MKTRAGIGTQTIAAIALVVVIVIAGGAYFAFSGAGSKSNTTGTTSTSGPSTLSSSSSSTSSVTSSTTTTSSATSTSSTSKTTKSSAPEGLFGFSLSANSNQFAIGPGDSTNNLVLTVDPGASGMETVSLNGNVTGGLGVSFEFPSIILNGGQSQMTQIYLSAPQSEPSGNYTITVTGTSGNQSATASIQVRVVQYLVYLSYYEFDSNNVSVPAGSTVYFFNTDAPHDWCGETDSGNKIISFTSIVSTTSPTLSSFTIWGVTLAQAGTYTYMDTLHPTSGSGTVVAH